ncbi:MAG: hypothetical protein H7Y00_08935 [Fimbriimonadaceae bacterium]|nr:hypothetical protein [Chitinophagales bacterium]
MLILKEHLLYQYNWVNEVNHELFTGDATRRSFDKLNGDQVLFIINLYGSLAQTFSVADGQRIEEVIKNWLPTDIKSEVSVLKWLPQTFLI